MSLTENNQMDFKEKLSIDIEPGKTHVLEITAKPIETPTLPEEPETGAIEIQLVDEQGNPFDVGPVYLVDNNGFFTVGIVKDQPEKKGYGRLYNIPVGIYTVTLEKPLEGAAIANEKEIEIKSGKLSKVKVVTEGASGKLQDMMLIGYEDSHDPQTPPIRVQIKLHLQQGIDLTDIGKLYFVDSSSRYFCYIKSNPDPGPGIHESGHTVSGAVNVNPGRYKITIVGNSEIDCSKNQPAFVLAQSVEDGEINDPFDVQALKGRLYDLGFNWVNLNNPEMDEDTIETIKLFQAIKNGHTKYKNFETTTNADGNKIIANQSDKYPAENNGKVIIESDEDDTYSWLKASNAPKWQRMPVGTSEVDGFYNLEVGSQENDNYDWGTNWLAETIEKTGDYYYTEYFSQPDQEDHTKSEFTINDVSIPRGGVALPHKTHQTGLSCDIRLPDKSGTASGGITWGSSQYDSLDMEAMLKALLDHPGSLVTEKQGGVTRQPVEENRSIHFNHGNLIDLELCQYTSNHDNHAHFDIVGPVKGEVKCEDDAPIVDVEVIDFKVEMRVVVDPSIPANLKCRITHINVDNRWNLVNKREIPIYENLNLCKGDRDWSFMCYKPGSFEQDYHKAKYAGEERPDLATAQHVKHLQEDLIRLGFTEVGEPNGFFDEENTEAAVKKFQEDAGADIDEINGVVNEQTRDAIKFKLQKKFCQAVNNDENQDG